MTDLPPSLPPVPPPADAAAPADVGAPAQDATVPLPPVVDAAAPDMGPGPGAPGPSPMSVALYDEATIVDLFVSFPAGQYERMLSNAGPTDTRWVACSFRALGSAETPARCRRKGTGEDWRFEKKPQILVKFNHLDKSARFRGLRRINLEAFDGTEAPIRDRVGMWLMREAGLDAPRVNHARLHKDGVYFGLYQNIESLDKEFLEDHFGAEGEGNLWESGHELKTNETVPIPTRLPALDALIAAEPLGGDHTAFYTALDGLIDVDQFLTEMAGETVLLADDNFSNGSSNYAYYEHPRRGFLVLPWDFDSILNVSPNADLYDYRGVSNQANKLRLLMNQHPGWKQKFDEALIALRDEHLSRLPAKVDAVCAQIAPAVMTDPTRTATFADFQADCAKVKATAQARSAAMKVMLGR